MPPKTSSTTNPTLWHSVREALRGSHQDYTAGSLNRSILLLAIPMVLEMVLESLFAVVDVFWVSRLGADAIATVGLTESVLTLVFAVGMGLGMSTTAMVARRIGEKDPEGAAVCRRTGHFSRTDCFRLLWAFRSFSWRRTCSRYGGYVRPSSPAAPTTRASRSADPGWWCCCSSTTPSSAAPAMRPLPCACCGSRTSST